MIERIGRADRRAVEVERERQATRRSAVAEAEGDRVRLVRSLGERHVDQREPGALADGAIVPHACAGDRAALGAEPPLARQRRRQLARDRPLERGGDP